MSYNREKVYEYAKKWAYGRNPKYYNFDSVGGDCTNFVSQCMKNGGAPDINYGNYTGGWYKDSYPWVNVGGFNHGH